MVRARGDRASWHLGMHMDHQTLRQKASLWMTALDGDETLFVLDESTWVTVVWSARQAWRRITTRVSRANPGARRKQIEVGQDEKRAHDKT